MIQIKQEFDIGDKVYYNLPESPEGLVVDIQYYHSSGVVYYIIQWDPEQNPTTCRSFELLRERKII